MDTGTDADFLNLLPEPSRAGLFELGRICRFLRGTRLLRQGETARHVLILRAGRAKVLHVDRHGSTLLLAMRRPVDLLGESALLDDQPRVASVVAADSCVAQVVLAAEFRAFVEDHHAADAVLRNALTRLRESDGMRRELASLPVRTRVVRALLRLAADASTDRNASIVRIGQEELAQTVGASRNAVVNELAHLRASGLIRTGRARTTLLDVLALRDLAD